MHSRRKDCAAVSRRRRWARREPMVEAPRDSPMTVRRAVSAKDAQTTVDDVEAGGMTGVIDGIAFQTTLRALDAAVEAARGEQGRARCGVIGLTCAAGTMAFSPA
jgi:hypothetical protein